MVMLYCRKCVTEVRCALEARFGHYLLEHNYGTSFMMDVCDWVEVLELIKFNPDLLQFEIKMSNLLKLGFVAIVESYVKVSLTMIDENKYFFCDYNFKILSINQRYEICYAEFNPARPMNWYVIQGLSPLDTEFLVPIHPQAPHEIIYEFVAYSIKEKGIVPKSLIKETLRRLIAIHSKVYFSSIDFDTDSLII